MVFGRARSKEEQTEGLGLLLKDRNLISSDEEIFSHGYNGGKVTTVLNYLLEKNEIDGAVISCWGESSPYPWFPWPSIATTRQDLIKGTGSKYAFSPNLMALEEIASRDDLRAVALVGLGCQIQAFRKLQLMGDAVSSLVEKVKYAFGLYCGAPMVGHGDFMEHVGELCGVPPEEITTIDFHRVSKEFDVSYIVVLKDGSKADCRMNVMEVFQALARHRRWYRCMLCTDYAADHADISFGGAHVTSRTSVGEDLLSRVLAEGRLVDAPANEIMDATTRQIDKSMGRMKKVKNVQRIADYREKGKPVPNYD
jgi:coenzyme F420 hydrogenase subunit beta